MNLSARDRRALAWLAVAVVVGLVVYYWPAGGGAPVVAPSSDAITLSETRLARLREVAATVSAKENVLKKVSADLAVREKGIIQADSAAQAQAQLIQIVRRLGAAENPPIEIRSTELNAIHPFGDSYGEASV
jgi:type II secretory pathway component PulM